MPPQILSLAPVPLHWGPSALDAPLLLKQAQQGPAEFCLCFSPTFFISLTPYQEAFPCSALPNSATILFFSSRVLFTIVRIAYLLD